MGKNLNKALLSILKEEKEEEQKVEETNSIPTEIASGLEIWNEENINASLASASATADYPEEEVNSVKEKIIELSGSLKSALENINWEQVDLETMPKMWYQGTDGWNMLSQVDTSILEEYVEEVIDWANGQSKDGEGNEESEEEENPVKYEESAGFEHGRKMNKLIESSVFSLEDLKKYPEAVLEEYSFSKGFEYKGNETLNRLLESGRVTKENLDKFYENYRKNFINENLVTEIETETYPEEIDFKNITHMLKFTEDDPEYELLSDMPGEQWETYVNDHLNAGIEVKYDSVNDVFIINPYTEELEEGERYEIPQEDKEIVEGIISEKKYKLIECRGALKSTNKVNIMEMVVEKDGNQTTIIYDDAAISKPWKISYNEFNLLQEALNSIHIPFRKLVNDTIEASRKISKTPMILEKIQKQYSNKTQDLPLAERERRDLRGAEITKQIFGSDIKPNEEENNFKSDRLA